MLLYITCCHIFSKSFKKSFWLSRHIVETRSSKWLYILWIIIISGYPFRRCGSTHKQNKCSAIWFRRWSDISSVYQLLLTHCALLQHATEQNISCNLCNIKLTNSYLYSEAVRDRKLYFFDYKTVAKFSKHNCIVK